MADPTEIPYHQKMPTSPEARIDSRKEWKLLLILSCVQITHIVDFMILMPLGPQFMRAFGINPQQFGFLVSAYTFAASVMGFLSAFIIDRFGRKTALLGLYAGFTLGTLLCALAPNYEMLLLARIVAGGFGGVMNAILFSIIGDAFPENRRGAATGTLMGSFSLASIAGVPLGLFLANLYGWHAPFYFLVILSTTVWAGALWVLPSLRGHLEGRQKENPLKVVFSVLADGHHWRAFVFTMTLMFAGFSIIPYISPFFVTNGAILETHLPYLYFCGGAVTLFSSRFIGKLADKHGKREVFTVVCAASILPILLITNLPPTSLPMAMALMTTFMVLTSGRFVPAMAMITATVEPRRRGSFMSVNSSLQQLASGLAAMTSGLIIVKSPDGRLLHYNRVGWIAVLSAVVTLFLVRRIRPARS